MKSPTWMLAFAVVVFALNAGDVRAADAKLTLTPKKQTALLALKPLRGPGIDRALFDGRPLLVTFFASW